MGEKGSASFELIVNGSGGHSSMPPPPPNLSPVGVLSKALLSLEQHPFPIRDQYARMMLQYLAAEVCSVTELGVGVRSLPVMEGLRWG